MKKRNRPKVCGRLGRTQHISRLAVEPLEDRRLLTVVAEIVGGQLQVFDANGVDDTVEETNQVTLSRVPQPGGDLIRVASPDGVLLGGGGGVPVSSVDFDVSAITTSSILVDLQEGDDLLRVDGALDGLKLDARAGGPGTGSDTLDLQATAGITEAVTIAPDYTNTDRQHIFYWTGSSWSKDITTIGYEIIRFVGEGSNDTLTVNLGRGTAEARVQNQPGLSVDHVISDTLPEIQFEQLDTFEIMGDAGRLPTARGDGSDDPKVVTFATSELEGARSYFFSSPRSPDTLIIEGVDGRDDEFFVTYPTPGEVRITDWNLGTPTIAVTARGFPGIPALDPRGASFTRSTGDRVEIRGLGGDDLVTVALSGASSTGTAFLEAAPITFDGGPPGATDALVIASTVDIATGDVIAQLPNDSHMVVVNHSRIEDDGVVRVFQDDPDPGPDGQNPNQLIDIAFTNVEVISPLLNATPPNLLILGPDLYEQNEFLTTAAFIGAGETLNVTDLAIFPNDAEFDNVPQDEDWFQFVAANATSMTFRVYFREFSSQLLPNGGMLNIELYDDIGMPTSGVVEAINNGGGTQIGKQITVDNVAEGNVYYLRVIGENTKSINGYDITVLNPAGPCDPVVPGPGPQVTNVQGVTTVGGTPFGLFGLKDPLTDPSQLTPTPLTNFLDIQFDHPTNPGVLDALQAANSANYLLVGDHTGVVPITGPITWNAATFTVTLPFFRPLADDRYTLTIQDSLIDPDGNSLDGESNASEPTEAPVFPSGNGIAGGNFVARFTIDSRPEVGTWAGRSVAVDINGNGYFDPDNIDSTNRDIVFFLGTNADDIFAGRFVLDSSGVANGFDGLAAFGLLNGEYTWHIDTSGDGVPDRVVLDSTAVNGRPVAGEFDGDPDNGDEIGIFTGNRWLLDANHDFLVGGTGDIVVNWNGSTGTPIVGNFVGDSDSGDDLAVFANDQFIIAEDLAGTPTVTIDFGFPGVRERPVAGDIDQDGYDDLGLFVPDQDTVSPDETAEWFFLVSGGTAFTSGPAAFTPMPFGNDVFLRFGNEDALPVFGNFDPPIAAAAVTNQPSQTADSSQTEAPTNADSGPPDTSGDRISEPAETEPQDQAAPASDPDPDTVIADPPPADSEAETPSSDEGTVSISSPVEPLDNSSAPVEKTPPEPVQGQTDAPVTEQAPSTDPPVAEMPAETDPSDAELPAPQASETSVADPDAKQAPTDDPLEANPASEPVDVPRALAKPSEPTPSIALVSEAKTVELAAEPKSRLRTLWQSIRGAVTRSEKANAARAADPQDAVEEPIVASVAWAMATAPESGIQTPLLISSAEPLSRPNANALQPTLGYSRIAAAAGVLPPEGNARTLLLDTTYEVASGRLPDMKEPAAAQIEAFAELENSRQEEKPLVEQSPWELPSLRNRLAAAHDMVLTKTDR